MGHDNDKTNLTDERSIEGRDPARYFVVDTSSGSRYIIDTLRRRLQRLPRSNIPADAIASVDLRRDGEWLAIQGVLELTVGHRAVFLLAPLGGPGTSVTVRETTPVVSIRAVEADGTPGMDELANHSEG